MFDGIFGYCDVNPEQEKNLGLQNGSIEQFLLTFFGEFERIRKVLHFKVLAVTSFLNCMKSLQNLQTDLST